MKAGKQVKNKGAVAYDESSLTVHNPLFFVHKLGLNKIMRGFNWSVSQFKMIAVLLNVVHGQVQRSKT